MKYNIPDCPFASAVFNIKPKRFYVMEKEIKEPEYIVSRSIDSAGKSRGKIWMYVCDNGIEYESVELAKIKNITPQCLNSRVKYEIEKFGEAAISNPRILFPREKKIENRRKRTANIEMSCSRAKELLNKFNRERSVKSYSPFVHIPGYEPVLVEGGKEYSAI